MPHRVVADHLTIAPRENAEARYPQAHDPLSGRQGQLATLGRRVVIPDEGFESRAVVEFLGLDHHYSAWGEAAMVPCRVMFAHGYGDGMAVTLQPCTSVRTSGKRDFSSHDNERP
jgi:hypothetical protein